MPGRNGPIAQAVKLVRPGRLLEPQDQVLILKAAGLLLGEYATSASEKAAVQAFQNRDRIGSAMQEALIALEDRGSFSASEKRILTIAMGPAFTHYGESLSPVFPPDVALEKAIIEAAAAKEMLAKAADVALDARIVAESKRNRYAAGIKAPDDQLELLAERAREAQEAYRLASEAVDRQAGKVQDLLNRRANRNRMLAMRESIKT
jgi:hypothetical protein